MDLLLLKTFMSVTEHGSFSAAAAELNSVQSNITARIRKLEEHYGHAVFVRNRSGARLTEFGERLKKHAADLLERVREAEHDLLDAAADSAPLRVAAMETAAAVRLPAILKRLRISCPKSPISLQTGSTGRISRLVWERTADVAFVAGPADRDRFRSVHAFAEVLSLVTGSNGEGGSAMLALSRGCSYRARAETWLRETGKPDTEIIEMGSMEAILGCVEAGMGFAVAPESSVARYHNRRALKMQPLPEEYRHIAIELIWRHDRKPTRAHRELLDILQTKQ